jgi:hypothetical protein
MHHAYCDIITCLCAQWYKHSFMMNQATCQLNTNQMHLVRATCNLIRCYVHFFAFNHVMWRLYPWLMGGFSPRHMCRLATWHRAFRHATWPLTLCSVPVFFYTACHLASYQARLWSIMPCVISHHITRAFRSCHAAQSHQAQVSVFSCIATPPLSTLLHVPRNSLLLKDLNGIWHNAAEYGTFVVISAPVLNHYREQRTPKILFVLKGGWKCFQNGTPYKGCDKMHNTMSHPFVS